MKILIISPHFPPDHGGVSDHTNILARKLQEMGHSITVATAQENPENSSGFRFINVKRPWGLASLQTIIDDVKKNPTDLILIQYTPLSFAPKAYGVFPSFALFLQKIKKQAPIKMIAHEANYPIELNLKGVLLGISHVTQFSIFIHFIDRIFFSHAAQKEYWSQKIPWKKPSFECSPSFSNIPVKSSVEKPSSLDKETTYLTYFGGTHSSVQFPSLISSLKAAQKNFNEKTKLLMIGTEQKDWGQRTQEHELKDVIFCGKLSATEVSAYLQASQLILLPYQHGVTSRRGSLMAALSHAKPVITTFGCITRKDIPWQNFCFISSDSDPDMFVKNVLSALEKTEEAQNKAQAGKEFYQKNFSVECTAKKILNLNGEKMF